MLNELILKIWAQEAIQAKPYPSALFPPSPYYRFFQILARELKFSLSIVLGVCGGGDCLHLALGNPEGKIIGVDLINDHEEQLSYIKSTCPNFIFYKGDSVKSAKLISRAFGAIGFLFIDTIHEKDRTILEFEIWKPYLADEAIVCFDDLLREEMNGFWDWLPEPKLRINDLHPTAEGGFGVWWKK